MTRVPTPAERARLRELLPEMEKLEKKCLNFDMFGEARAVGFAREHLPGLLDYVERLEAVAKNARAYLDYLHEGKLETMGGEFRRMAIRASLAVLDSPLTTEGK